jgi:hypothetical protein
MMEKLVKFRYSKKAGFAGVLVLLVVAGLLAKTAVGNYLLGDMIGTVLFGLFALLIGAVMVIMLVARLMPALKGQVALELDKTGAKDYVRDIMVDWKDVEDVYLRPGRISALLVFELKFESDYGKQIGISLRWVEGRDTEIFDRVVAYFDEAEGITREHDL